MCGRLIDLVYMYPKYISGLYGLPHCRVAQSKYLGSFVSFKEALMPRCYDRQTQMLRIGMQKFADRLSSYKSS